MADEDDEEESGAYFFGLLSRQMMINIVVRLFSAHLQPLPRSCGALD